VLGDDTRRVSREHTAKPRELIRSHQRQSLVVRLEDLATLVELVAPRGLVLGDTRVQHEVVAPAGDRDRVELKRPESPEDRTHPVRASGDGPRRREQLPRDEEATCCLLQ
jgi:hypothetical protein